MYLTHHQTAQGPRWALDGRLLPPEFSLSSLLELRKSEALALLKSLQLGDSIQDSLLPPLDPMHEVWASGVTYRWATDAPKLETLLGQAYELVYNAERPELFFKGPGWRVVGNDMPIRVRKDSQRNAPEPELVIVANRYMEIIGYCAGNDVSSRDIVAVNPLYLPQAKVYNASCALGPGLLIEDPDRMRDLVVTLEVERGGQVIEKGETRTSKMKRKLEELVTFLGRELDFPHGVFLMTGTGILPPPPFSLQPGDVVRVTVGPLTLANEVHG